MITNNVSDKTQPVTSFPKTFEELLAMPPAEQDKISAIIVGAACAELDRQEAYDRGMSVGWVVGTLVFGPAISGFGVAVTALFRKRVLARLRS